MTACRLIRVPADLAEMIAAIVRHGQAENVPELVDPILRRPVERLFDKLPEVDKQYAISRIESRKVPAA